MFNPELLRGVARSPGAGMTGMRSAVALAALLFAGCGRHEPIVQGNHDARALLESAREATEAARAVRYRFEFAHRDAPVGWATGETIMQQRTDLSDSSIRVEGMIQSGPGKEPIQFLYVAAGSEAWSYLPATGRAEFAVAGAGGRSLGTLGVYGYLPEFVEVRPFWKELEGGADIRPAGRREVAGVACHVVEVVWEAGRDRTGPGTTRYEWYLGSEDLLPRGMKWINAMTGPEGFEFLLSGLEVLEGVDSQTFRFEPPAGSEVAAGAGAAPSGSPDWTLSSASGEEIRLSALRGQVVVLEFWNTWCFICREMLPRTAALAGRYAGSPVRFFGLNVFETGDPISYWRERGYGFDLLLDGDRVAALYDVPWQPAVVVLGPGGEILLNLLGGSHDRVDRIAAAIDRGLAAP
jgi:thiol-disulfide isomerase/thioredoxin